MKILLLLLFLPLAESVCQTTLPTDGTFGMVNQYHSGTPGTSPSTHLLSYSAPSSSYSLAYPLAYGSFLKAPTTQCPQSCLYRLRAMGKTASGVTNSVIMMWDSGENPPATNILYSAFTTTMVSGEYFYCSTVASTCGATVPLYLYYNSNTGDYQVRTTSDTNDDSGAKLSNMGLPICYLFPSVATSTSTGTSTSGDGKVKRETGDNSTSTATIDRAKQMMQKMTEKKSENGSDSSLTSRVKDSLNTTVAELSKFARNSTEDLMKSFEKRNETDEIRSKNSTRIVDSNVTRSPNTRPTNEPSISFVKFTRGSETSGDSSNPTRGFKALSKATRDQNSTVPPNSSRGPRNAESNKMSRDANSTGPPDSTRGSERSSDSTRGFKAFSKSTRDLNSTVSPDSARDSKRASNSDRSSKPTASPDSSRGPRNAVSSNKFTRELNSTVSPNSARDHRSTVSSRDGTMKATRSGTVTKGDRNGTTGSGSNGTSSVSTSNTREEEKTSGLSIGDFGGLMKSAAKITDFIHTKNLSATVDSVKKNVQNMLKSGNSSLNEIDKDSSVSSLIDILSDPKTLEKLEINLTANASIDNLVEKMKKEYGNVSLAEVVKSDKVEEKLAALGIDLPANLSISLLEEIANGREGKSLLNGFDKVAARFNGTEMEDGMNEMKMNLRKKDLERFLNDTGMFLGRHYEGNETEMFLEFNRSDFSEKFNETMEHLRVNDFGKQFSNDSERPFHLPDFGKMSNETKSILKEKFEHFMRENEDNQTEDELGFNETRRINDKFVMMSLNLSKFDLFNETRPHLEFNRSDLDSLPFSTSSLSVNISIVHREIGSEWADSVPDQLTLQTIDDVLSRMNTSLSEIVPSFSERNNSNGEPSVVRTIPFPTNLTENELSEVKLETADVAGIQVFADRLEVAMPEASAPAAAADAVSAAGAAVTASPQSQSDRTVIAITRSTSISDAITSLPSSKGTTVEARGSITLQEQSNDSTGKTSVSSTSSASSSTTVSSSTQTASSTTSVTGTSTTHDPTATTTAGSSSSGSTTSPDPTATSTTSTPYTGTSTTLDPTATTTTSTQQTGSTTTPDPTATTTTSTPYTGSTTIGSSTATSITTTTTRTTTTSAYTYDATTDASGTYGPGDQKLENGTVIRPNGDVIYANGTVKKEDGTIIEDGKKIDPDGTIHNADGSTQFTNGTIVYPSDSTVATGGSSDTPAWVIPVIIVAVVGIGAAGIAMIFFGVTSMMRGGAVSTGAVNPYDVPNGQKQWPNQRQPRPSSAELPPRVADPVTTAQPQSFGATQTLQGAPNSLYFG